MGLGDLSADLCIVEAAPSGERGPVPEIETPAVRREQGLLPSQAADNLYWLGRYGERGHQTVRVIRTLVEQVSIAGERADEATAVSRLKSLLRELEAVPPASAKWHPARLAGVALSDRELAGSVRSLANRGRQIALLLRDRLNRDSWRSSARCLSIFPATSIACRGPATG